jgi:hypothetical protein
MSAIKISSSQNFAAHRSARRREPGARKKPLAEAASG